MDDIETLLWSSDATALADCVRRREVTAAELVEASIRRAERLNPHINAIAERLFDAARTAAEAVDPDAAFSGVPMAIKDLGVSLKGVPVHWGSRISPVVADHDSLIVQRFRGAGFVPVATSTTPELGLRLVTETTRFGITRNPWNTGHVTGGSSGGSAAMVAAGVVPVAHASDGGGSIRVPAACCGLVGMKPSRGRVSFSPDFIEGWYGLLAQHAVTRSVRDSAALLDIVSAPDERAPYVAAAAEQSFAAAAVRRPKGLRIGVYRGSPLGLDISGETMSALDAAAAMARDAGHAVEDIDLPMIDRAFLGDFARLVASSVAGQLRVEADRLRGGRLERVARVLRRYGNMLGAGEVSAALIRLQLSTLKLLEATAQCDAVLMPVIAHPPLPCGGLDPKGLDLLSEHLLDALHLTGLLRVPAVMEKLIDQSLWFTHWPAIQNVTGQPAVAMPVHVTAEGLPLGIQAVGRMGGEATLFALAGQMEEMSGWLGRRAPLEAPARRA